MDFRRVGFFNSQNIIDIVVAEQRFFFHQLETFFDRVEANVFLSISAEHFQMDRVLETYSQIYLAQPM